MRLILLSMITMMMRTNIYAGALIDAITEGLLAAESMNLARIALICPAGRCLEHVCSQATITTSQLLISPLY